MPNAKLLINTVPQLVLPEERLALLPKEALVLDLASKPGGDDVATITERQLLYGKEQR